MTLSILKNTFKEVIPMSESDSKPDPRPAVITHWEEFILKDAVLSLKVNLPKGYPNAEKYKDQAAKACQCRQTGVCPHSRLLLETMMEVFGIEQDSIFTSDFCSVEVYENDSPKYTLRITPNPICTRILVALMDIQNRLTELLQSFPTEYLYHSEGDIFIIPDVLIAINQNTSEDGTNEFIGMVATLKHCRESAALLYHLQEKNPNKEILFLITSSCQELMRFVPVVNQFWPLGGQSHTPPPEYECCPLAPHPYFSPK